MTSATPNIRLFVEHDLISDQEFLIDGNQGHYLINVMRMKEGEVVALFNGRDGEWMARLEKCGKGKAMVKVLGHLEDQAEEPDLWYLFAPVKKARLDYMVEKAAELGVSRIQPVMTRRTIVDRVKEERLRANAIEAAEQCGRLTVPVIEEPVKLDKLLADWPDDRLIMFCDEAGGEGEQEILPVGQAVEQAAQSSGLEKWAVLIGPEGGFTPEERQMIRSHSQTVAVTLGPRILRADTAAVAAIALWQSFAGDWQ
ncbi:16S rRNA (uracil(1498)-N(3))-methyltransferase [Emcibacter sp.]|uniref:16S rRNA (uracil(1498)-N(3))-methyltransferase n=1 Tax=Emcibacter sp. TaxID=1979954 RepID=UPI002AA7664D|nr:16S rRNA (uracil(1498)-N(3))-methyltransferase [Emcibacter sp.]